MGNVEHKQDFKKFIKMLEICFNENFHFSVTLSKDRNAVKLLLLFECFFALLNVVL